MELTTWYDFEVSDELLRLAFFDSNVADKVHDKRIEPWLVWHDEKFWLAYGPAIIIDTRKNSLKQTTIYRMRRQFVRRYAGRMDRYPSGVVGSGYIASGQPVKVTMEDLNDPQLQANMKALQDQLKP